MTPGTVIPPADVTGRSLTPEVAATTFSWDIPAGAYSVQTRASATAPWVDKVHVTAQDQTRFSYSINDSVRLIAST